MVVETVVVPRENVPVLPIVIMPGLIVRSMVVSAALACCVMFRIIVHMSAVMITIDQKMRCLRVMCQQEG